MERCIPDFTEQEWLNDHRGLFDEERKAIRGEITKSSLSHVF